MAENIKIWLRETPPDEFPSPPVDEDPGCTAFFPSEEAESQAPQGAEFLTSVSWSYAPGSERRVGYFIADVDHPTWRWVLWAFNYSDNYMSWSWSPIAGSVQECTSHLQAGTVLLEQVWKWERTEWKTEAFEEAEGGLLDDDATYDLGDRIWD